MNKREREREKEELEEEEEEEEEEGSLLRLQQLDDDRRGNRNRVASLPLSAERQRDQSRRGKRRGGSYLCSPPMFLARNRRNVDRIFSRIRRGDALALLRHTTTTREELFGGRVGNRPSKGTSNTTTKEGRTKEAWSVCSSALWRRGIEKERGKKEEKKEEEKRGEEREGPFRWEIKTMRLVR